MFVCFVGIKGVIYSQWLATFIEVTDGVWILVLFSYCDCEFMGENIVFACYFLCLNDESNCIFLWTGGYFSVKVVFNRSDCYVLMISWILRDTGS